MGVGRRGAAVNDNDQAMDWADEMALDIIALVHRYRVLTVRQLVAAHLRVVRADGEVSGAKQVVAETQKVEPDARS